MEDDKMFCERQIKSQKALIKGLEDLSRMDIHDPDYAKKYEAVASLHRQIVEDVKNETNRKIETKKIEVEEEKNEMTKILESEKLQEEQKQSFWKNVLEGGKVVLSAGFMFATLWQSWAKFWRSTEKEKDEAYLTTSDKETVREGLREPTEKKWKLY